MPVHAYTNWNIREADSEEKIEPYRKYFIICEGANTEVFYFRELIDNRKQLEINPLIDLILWEKTDSDRDITYPKYLFDFAIKQKNLEENHFDTNHDKMVIVFDGDIFEEKVVGYKELISMIEENDIAAVTNPSFELFLLLHIPDSYNNYIKGAEDKYLTKDEKGKYSLARNILTDVTGINPKRNKDIGKLANNIQIAIMQEKNINQDVHNIKGRVSSNLGAIIKSIIDEKIEL